MTARRQKRVIFGFCWVFWGLFVAAMVGLVFAAGWKAHGHDSWISTGGYRNAAGEWCCGLGDCFVLPPRQVTERSDGYHLWLDQIVDGAERRTFEIVPYAESQPSPDGAFWRCKRPDGTRRCFFAPPPNT